MTRQPYTGATGRCLSLQDTLSLPDHWLAQPKMDGMYATVCTDYSGRITGCFSRSGRRVDSDIVGVELGVPGLVLAGELSAHTQAGLDSRQRAGCDTLQVFDCLAYNVTDLNGLGYSARRHTLMQLAMNPEFDPGRRPLKRTTQGRFVRRIPRGWSRCPVVPQVNIRRLPGVYANWLESGAEGAVLVHPDKAAGKRQSKKKVKVSDTLGCRVEQVSSRIACLLVMDEGEFSGLQFTVQSKAWAAALSPGDLVDVTHNGWYTHCYPQPRFPRITRIRVDLQ